MLRFALIAAPLALTTPALAADLDGPYYRESHLERPAPPAVVERERIIERTYYPAPRVYREQRVYVEEPVVAYVPRGFVEIPVPRAYVYDRWAPRRVIHRDYGWRHRYGRHVHPRW